MFKKTLVFLFIIATTSFQGFSQTQDLDKNMDKALEELSIMLDTLDLNSLFNFDIAKQLNEVKPDAGQIESMEEMMQQSIKMLQNMDLSAFEEMFQQLEGQFGEMEKMMPKSSPLLKEKESGKETPAKKKL